MQMAGHKTRSIFDRYHIVAETELREAADRLDRAIRPQTVRTLDTSSTEKGPKGELTH
jgi:hypothetical protein